MKIFIAIVLTLLFAFSVFAQKQAEIIVTTTYLRKSPDSSSDKIQTVQKGERITFEKSQDTNGWYFVSVMNGAVKGWIRKDTVRSVTNTEAVKQSPQANAETIKKVSQIAVPTPIPIASVTSTINASPTVSASPAISPSPSPAPSPIASPIPVEEEEVLRIETEEISLNVRVVDDNNRSVNNLNQSNFKVYEDDVLQPITSFTTTEVPVINALVIDNSRSLRSQLGKVIEAGKIIVGANHPKDETIIVRFVSKDKIEVVQDFTTNKSLLNNALDNLFVEGGQTAIIDAIYLAAKKVEQYQNSEKKDDVKLRALILVSDGDDRGSSYNEQQLFELLRKSSVQIYAVGFINNLSKEIDANGLSRQEKAKTFLTRLSQETGGKVYFPNSIDELQQIASDISGELRTQYLISYMPTNENRDGTFRKIKVSVTEGTNKEKRIALTRTGRTSAPK
ncbi:MAG: VWA domain-containing protein [Acidobacteria bacterium]|nr:VWA domain-containing protein [Acidobacteriota bacterium]MCA1637528.1 VWA domain-containing protein [Acidobacteriota bacterium]